MQTSVANGILAWSEYTVYVDYFIIVSETQENLWRLLSRAREHNVKFNRDKIELNKTEVASLGHIASAKSLKPDPSKMQAISEMPSPTDFHWYSESDGKLNSLKSFIPDMSTLTQPIKRLLKSEADWSLAPEQQEAMDIIRKCCTVNKCYATLMSTEKLPFM